MKRRNKRGVSLAEAAIAITVITIVSVAALSTILFSINAQQRVINETEAQNFAASVFESFKAADTAEKFEANVSFSEGLTPTNTQKDDSTGTVAYSYTSDRHAFGATVRINYSTGDLDLKVFDEDGGSIVIIEYKKGVTS